MRIWKNKKGVDEWMWIAGTIATVVATLIGILIARHGGSFLLNIHFPWW